MTIEEIARKACQRLNLQDTYSINKAIEYAKQRWQTIWNCHLWKDSVGYASVQAEMDGNKCILRVPLERVRAIRYDNYAIYPIDPCNVFQLDASAFDGYGDVCGFTSLGKDENGNRLVHIMKIPSDLDSETFLVMGKMKCPTLENGDEPFLTGVEDALTEFVAGDLWMDDQQQTKGATAYSNGSTFVEQMRKIDGEQSASNPRFIPDGGVGYQARDFFED